MFVRGNLRFYISDCENYFTLRKGLPVSAIERFLHFFGQYIFKYYTGEKELNNFLS